MIRVAKPPQQDQEWQAIFSQAIAGRAQLIREFDNTGDATVNTDLYGSYKRFLLAVFNQKCAYCETVIGSNQPGDVEHFRPKGRVVDGNFKPVKVRYERWGEVLHPGYYWLAYDWDNLFPSCTDCNRRRNHGTGADVAAAGKGDRFPVKGTHAHVPDGEHNESALLINPSKDEPGEHLQFLDTGEVEARTEKGAQTWKLLGLNRREVLLKERKRAFDDACALLQQYCAALIYGGGNRENLRKRINAIWEGLEAYTAMQRLAFEAVKKSIGVGGLRIDFPLPPEP